MRYPAHVAVGLLTGQLVALGFDQSLMSPTTWLSLGACAVMSTLPDVDQTQSYAGRRLILVSYALKLFRVRHRSWTHSLLMVGLLGLLLAFTPLPAYWIAILLAGYASHLLIDMFNPSGIELLWPNRVRYRLLPQSMCIPTNSTGELLFLIVAMISVALVFYGSV